MSENIIDNMQYNLFRVAGPATRVPTGIATSISRRAD